ncbi:hypothetical protein [Oscillatoria sp. HE19RPO]|nr:hypothetical protein [Oscillatoria sp. HE19RPO]
MGSLRSNRMAYFGLILMSPLTETEWQQFTGTSYHRHWVNRFVYT